MNFGEALEQLKLGAKIARKGWNGKEMWIELSEYDENAMYKDRPLQQHILMATVQNTYVPWTASQTDILAEDWVIILGK